MGFGNSLRTGYEAIIQERVRDFLFGLPHVVAEMTNQLEVLGPYNFGLRLSGNGKGAVGGAFLNIDPDDEEPWLKVTPFIQFLQREAEKDPFLASDEFKLDYDETLFIKIGTVIQESSWWEKNKKEVRKAQRDISKTREVHAA